MKIPLDEISQTPKEIRFSENLEGLEEVYRRSKNREFSFPSLLAVALTYYRTGRDIVLDGRLSGKLSARCGRCLEDFVFDLEKRFASVLTPRPNALNRRAEELNRDDLDLSYYSTEEIDMSPLIAEQVLLALPTRPLCRESCRGLCGACGANLNFETCSCSAAGDDPRLAIFRTLKVGR